MGAKQIEIHMCIFLIRHLFQELLKDLSQIQSNIKYTLKRRKSTDLREMNSKHNNPKITYTITNPQNTQRNM